MSIWKRTILAWMSLGISLTLLGLAGCGPSDNDQNGAVAACDSPETLTTEDVNGGAELEKNCYLAEDDLLVDNGTLVLNPGVVIQFAEDVGLDIQNEGRLNAEGTKEAPIILTGTDETRGFWQGVRFQDSNSEENVFRHVTLEYAGSGRWTGGGDSKAGLFLQREAQISISNSKFLENAQAGALVKDPATWEVSDSNFVSNAHSIVVTAGDIGGIKSGNTFEDNDNSYILVGPKFFESRNDNSTVKQEATWRAHDVPYRMHQNTDVSAAVTIEPGATLIFSQSAKLQVDDGGSLNADASDGEQITFTGNEEIPGFWKGIGFFTLSEDNVLRNVVVEYGGGSGFTGGSNSLANIFLRGSTGPNAQVEVADASIRNSGKHGISIQEGSNIVGCSDLMFEGNDGRDIFVQKDDSNTPDCLAN